AMVNSLKSMSNAANTAIASGKYPTPTQTVDVYITLSQLEIDGFLKPYTDPFLSDQSLLIKTSTPAPTSDSDAVTMVVVKAVSGSKQLKYYVKYVTTKASGEDAYRTKGTNGLVEASTITKDDLELTP
ncbi:MAG: hypothetical protein ACRC5C_02995, partial [Bacilli bacterium]